MELINGQQTVVEFCYFQFFESKTECGVGADKNPFVTAYKVGKGFHLAFASIVSGRTKVVVVVHLPIGKKAGACKVGTTERPPNGSFRHSHNNFTQTLMYEFVQGYKHQCARLARSRWRFEEQVLCIAGLKGFFLHFAHPHGVGLCAFACLCVSNMN